MCPLFVTMPSLVAKYGEILLWNQVAFLVKYWMPFLKMFFVIIGGAGGGFSSKGQDSRLNKTGKGGEGYLNGGEGGANHGGFGGGGGLHGNNGGAGGGGGYSGGSGGVNEDISCGGGGGSFNNGTNKKNECCYNSAGHGKVIITFLK